MKLVLGFSLILTGILYSSSAHAAESEASRIIRKGEKILRGNSTQALMTMIIQRPSYSRTLELRSWTVGNKQALVEILAPHKELGVSSLRVETNMWNYLPKVDQVVRVPTSLMLQPWMGSDFTNDDLMKASSLVRDYTHKIVKKDKSGTLIVCTPKPGAPVVWGKLEYWARPDSLPTKQKFYDEDGQWVRTITFDRFKKMDDRIIPTRMSVQLAEEPKNRTVVTYHKILYDKKIDSELFQTEKLRKNSQRGQVITAGWSMISLGKRK